MIYNVNRERDAMQQIVPLLESLHTDLTTFAATLRNTGIVINAWRIRRQRDDLQVKLDRFNAFRTSDGTWFTSAYADYKLPLDGAIISVPLIITAVDLLINTSYTSAGSIIVKDVTQTDRNLLAGSVEAELE